MNDLEIEDAVRNHPFCLTLSKKSLSVLSHCASMERYPARHLVFSEGSDADRFYLLRQGQIELELFVPGSGVALIQTVHAGEAFGTSALFDGYRWAFSAQTVVPSELITFTASTLRSHAGRDPEFEKELMARLAPILFHRLQALRRRLIEFFVPA